MNRNQRRAARQAEWKARREAKADTEAKAGTEDVGVWQWEPHGYFAEVAAELEAERRRH